MDNTTDNVIYTFLSVVTLLKSGELLQQLFIQRIKQTTSSSTLTNLLKKLRLSPEAGLEVLTRNEDRYIKDMKELYVNFMRLSGDNLFTHGTGRSNRKV
jgi:hypothetical protein